MVKSFFKTSLRQFVSIAPSFWHRVAVFLMRHSGYSPPTSENSADEAKLSAKPINKKKLCHDFANLSQKCTHADFLQLLSTQQQVTPFQFYGYVNKIFADRRFEALDQIINHPSILFKDIQLFYSIRRSQFFRDGQWSARQIALSQAVLAPTSFVWKKMRHALLEQAVREKNISLINEQIKMYDDVELSECPKNTLMGMCRLMIMLNENDLCRSLLERFLPNLPAERQLHFFEIAKNVFGQDFEPEISTWRDVLQRLESLYQPADGHDAKHFRQLVLSPLQAIPAGADRDFMDIRLHTDQQEVLLDRICQALRTRQPLSLIRLGDGEAYAFCPPNVDGITPEEFENDNDVRERHWWGTTLDRASRIEIQQLVRQAVCQADILGVPSIYRVIRDLGRNNTRFGANRGQRGLMVVLNALGKEIGYHDKDFTEDRCHQILFNEASLARLCDEASSVIFVGCWARDQLQLPGQATVKHMMVSAHSMVEQSAAGNQEPIYSVYPQVMEELEASAKPGVLVLVSAGVIGKIFCGCARRQGAVAVDLGAIADYLAGHPTRSIGDLVEVGRHGQGQMKSESSPIANA